MTLSTWLTFFVVCWLISRRGPAAVWCLRTGMRVGFRRVVSGKASA